MGSVALVLIKMSNKYTVDYFIEKFEAIPEENWTRGSISDGNCKCALGHCGVVQSDDGGWILNDESKALGNLFYGNESIRVKYEFDSDYVADERIDIVWNINDIYRDDMGLTPKKRILRALEMVKNNE